MDYKTVRIGLYGKGRWARTLRSKILLLGERYNIVFEADSKNTRLDESDLRGIDWAFVATTPETHYEIVDTCLRAGINVFCEKPLSTSVHEVRSLYALADEMGVCLYVDDVFLWREQYKVLDSKNTDDLSAQWHKANNEDLSGLKLVKDLAYHHIYMLGDLFGYPDFRCETKEYTSGLSVDLVLNGRHSVTLAYSKNAQYNIHKFLGVDFANATNDALIDMLQYVFTLKITPSANKKLTLWTTDVIRAITTSRPEKVAVVGGGIFGCTAALELAKNGYDVTLYEARSDIVQGATLKNQLRLHRGYHYPRSDETVEQCRASDYKFRAYFRSSVDASKKHYYAIASHDSKITPQEYEQFMNRHKLEYTKIDNESIGNALNMDAISAIYEVKECSYNPHELKTYLKRRCLEEGVKFVLGSRVRSLDDLSGGFHRYVVATYASPMLDSIDEMQFEVCEKPVVRLPEKYRGLSMVILDGPFVSLDPYSADPALHLVGSVSDAIHHTNTGLKPFVPEAIKPYINKGLIKNPKITKIDKFKKRFANLYNLEESDIEHVGSYFVVRAVEAHRDIDDRRISVLQEITNNVSNIFSAKVTSAPLISQELVKQFETRPLHYVADFVFEQDLRKSPKEYLSG